jgi:hypothetical protein
LIGAHPSAESGELPLECLKLGAVYYKTGFGFVQNFLFMAMIILRLTEQQYGIIIHVVDLKAMSSLCNDY